MPAISIEHESKYALQNIVYNKDRKDACENIFNASHINLLLSVNVICYLYPKLIIFSEIRKYRRLIITNKMNVFIVKTMIL